MVKCSKKQNIFASLAIYKKKLHMIIPYDNNLTTPAKNIRLDINANKENIVILRNTDIVKMSMISQKDLYEDAILKTTADHVYQVKWVEKLQIVIVWDEIWNTVHHFVLSNRTETIIWEQLPLNFYTQYSYNKYAGYALFAKKYWKISIT